ncbi:MAG TPA: chemotaxis protein CheB [Anaerolineales bacterium]|nr:chemotaxis protein CheB [Anaerolineales bacterium]
MTTDDKDTFHPENEKASEAIGATSGIPVIGIGGSAGALESFKNFLTAVPVDSGAAVVIIQHLAPAHPSMLMEILAQHTRMEVREIREGMPVEPNCVYVIPPNKYVGIRDGILYLSEPVTEHGIRMPIDFFLRSLAEDRQERAICILLSGAGSDGTLGLRAIRGAGGLTIAQDHTAQFGEMPGSAVATGLVDFILPPDQMPKTITEYLQQPYIRGGEPAAVVEAEGKHDGLGEILDLVREQTRSDFRCYKKSTILRRIERRMGLHHIEEISRYAGMLRQDVKEIGELHKDLLINVTSFFRDAEAFDELRSKAIMMLAQSKQMDDPFRVWVPGCSSGEEAYSIAMLLLEEVEAARKHNAVQVFATDIDEDALQFARTGIYPESIVADIGKDRISKFFFRKDGNYHVSEHLRGTVVFAAQNLITDPPFSKMDLISCRNLLIYIDAETQSKLVPLFNFALKPGGYLFLGKSEGVGGHTELFEAVSKKARLYRRLTPIRPIALDSPILPGRKKVLPSPGPTERKLPATSYADSVRQALLNHFAASVVLIDRRGQVLQFHGQTVKYLDMPTSEPSLNLLDIAKEGLGLKIRSALHQALSESKTVVIDPVKITQDAGASFARVTVSPITPRGDSEPLLAVIFEDIPRPAAAESEPVRDSENAFVIQLENELRATQQDLQSSIEEQQASNEELRIANEEVISTNEELQSTNEELETSKEELQSVNEELTTVNSQLQEKVESLNKANRDMQNFLESTQIATLFLDCELRIMLFTPATTRLFNLIPSDTGRSIRDFSTNFMDYDLSADARTVAQEAIVIEREVRRADGPCYLVRFMPYCTQNNKVDGVIITFGDITSLRRAEKQIRRLATAMMDSNDAVILFDLKGNVQAWNHGAQNMYGWSESEALTMSFLDFVSKGKDAEHAALMNRLLIGDTIASFETHHVTKDGRILDVWLTATALLDNSGKAEGFCTTGRDITEHRRRQDELKTLNEALLERTAEAETRAEQLRKMAAELNLIEKREQQRIAQVLHDDLQQTLVAAKYHLSCVPDSRNVPQATAEVSDLIGEAIATSRRLTTELNPPVPQQGGFTVILEWLAKWMQDMHGLEVKVAAPWRSEVLPENIAFFLFRTVRELLFNVVKHAGVKAARIEVNRADDLIQIIVEDEGAGFDPSVLDPAWESLGFGLSSIRERLAVLGGRMEIDSASGQGSRVRLVIPVDD